MVPPRSIMAGVFCLTFVLVSIEVGAVSEPPSPTPGPTFPNPQPIPQPAPPVPPSGPVPNPPQPLPPLPPPNPPP
jgi:hypothetical protein